MYNVEKIPDRCGTYIILFESGKRYIGSSCNIRKRIYVHIRYFRDFRCDSACSVFVCLTNNRKESLELEREYIRCSDPNILYNINFVRTTDRKPSKQSKPDSRLIDFDKLVDMQKRIISRT